MSRQDDLRKLITEHERRLQKLEEQRAKLGINTTPEVLNEIEDIRAEIERLKIELAALTHDPGRQETKADSLSSTEAKAISIPSNPPDPSPKTRVGARYSPDPTILPGPKIHLTAQIETTLRAMFSEFDQLHVEREFGRGLTNTRVFKVRPLKRGQAKDYLPVVVKVGPVDLIKQEWQAYQQWVAHTMDAIARIDNPPALPQGGGWAGLCYTLAGGDVHDFESLNDYCRRPEVEEPHQLLERRLFRRMSERWWSNVRVAYVQMQAEYDNLLPVNLMIKPLATPPSGVVHQLQPGSQLTQPVAAGDHVYLQDFIITEVEAEKQPRQVTLNLPEAGEVPPRLSYRLRLVDVPDIDRYIVGHTISPIYGVVTATRHDLLTAQAQKALRDETLDLSAGRLRLSPGVSIPLPPELPNPLTTYQDILQSFNKIKISTIHGDLNLENVLVVDPEAGDLYLIDFAASRQGHVLHDLLHLEQGVVTQLLSAALAEAGLPAQTLWTIYRQLHQAIVYPGQAGPPALPHPALQKPFALLAAIRAAARDCLVNSRDWTEYYQGLILYLLAALKFNNLDQKPEAPLPKQSAFWAAAASQALLDSSPPPPAPEQRVLHSVEEVIFKEKSGQAETRTLEDGEFKPNESKKQEKRSKPIMTDNDSLSSGVTIGNVSGGMSGNIISGRDVTNATITGSGQQAAAAAKPTIAGLRQLLWEIRQTLEEVMANMALLEMISDDLSHYAQVTLKNIETVTQKIEAANMLEAPETAAIQKHLTKASGALASIITDARDFIPQDDKQDEAVKPLVNKLEIVVERVEQATSLVTRL